jgi:hypothetical protein
MNKKKSNVCAEAWPVSPPPAEAELRSEGSLTSLEMNLLILVVHLIMLGKDISSQTTSARSDRPDKLTDLNDSIRRQMV